MASGIITGKTNIPTKLAKYEGLTTDTASITVNNEERTIRADVNVEEVTKNCATKEELDLKADKIGPLPSYTVNANDNVVNFIYNNNLNDKQIIINFKNSKSLIGKFSLPNLSTARGSMWFLDTEGFYYSAYNLLFINKAFSDIFIDSTYRHRYEDESFKVTSLSSSSTNLEYPSAKCVYDAIQSVKESGIDISKLPQINAGSDSLTEEQYNSLKGKTWYSLVDDIIVYPFDNNNFFIINYEGITIINYSGTGEEFTCRTVFYKLLSEEKYDELTQPISATGSCEINDIEAYVAHITINKERMLPKWLNIVSKDRANPGGADILLFHNNNGQLVGKIYNTSGIFANATNVFIDYMYSGNGNTSISFIIECSTQVSQISVSLDIYLYEVVISDYTV